MEVTAEQQAGLSPAHAPSGAPRGVPPSILLEQIRVTAPFLFEEGANGASLDRYPYLKLIRELAAQPERELTHEGYYELCISAHHATVCTFVPTDVDNQIRFRLWHPSLPLETTRAMARKVLESRAWDCRPVSTRWVASPRTGAILSGHLGEWFSTAAGAYCALRRRDPELAATVAGEIVDELHRHAAIFKDLRAARDGIGMLIASYLIAHNLGDLDRVMDMWNLAQDDALREAAYKAGHERFERFGGVFAAACALNKACMADENHRHFALREARALRRSADLLLPSGPFFDEWGSRVARHPMLSPEEVGQVAEALVAGWERLAKAAAGKGTPAPVGYARALNGIIEGFPGGFARLSQYIPARVERALKAGPLRALMAVPRHRFEEQWAHRALKS